MTTIAFTGDVGFSKYFKDGYKKEDILSKEVVDFLASTDYTVVNVEGAVSNITSTATKPLVHTNNPEMVEWIKKINGNVWNVANNHTMDCGEEGALDTLRHARENGCLTVGLGENADLAAKPLFLEKDGVKIGLISVTYDDESAAGEHSTGCIHISDNERIKAQIEEVKSQNAWCVVIPHGFEEFSQLPVPYARKQYIKYLKFGADIVVGHHPHVVQNYETFGDKIIFYSLGNFIFDTDYQRRQKYTDRGMLLKIHFEANTYTWEYLPIKIDRTTQTVGVGEKPAIFCDINKVNYHILWPYAAKDFHANRRKIFIYLLPERADWDERAWRKFELSGCLKKVTKPASFRRRRAWRMTLKGSFLSIFQLWRLGPKDIIEYLK